MAERQVRFVVAVAMLAACGRDGAHVAPSPTPFEQVIDRELGARFGVAVVTRCFGLACRAVLPDRTVLPVVFRPRADGWEWQVEGLVITTDAITAYLQDELADLGVAQAVQCGARVRRISPDDRIECGLARGGKAFVTVHADGTTALELALDPAAAAARSEPVTPAHERNLLRASRVLEGEAADEEEEPDPAATAPKNPR